MGAAQRGDDGSVGGEGAGQAGQVQAVEDGVVADLQHGRAIRHADGEGDDGVVQAGQLVHQVARVHGVLVHNHLHLQQHIFKERGGGGRVGVGGRAYTHAHTETLSHTHLQS